MENKIKKTIIENSNQLFGLMIDENLIQFQKTRKEIIGDITLVTFPFAKIVGATPQVAAEKIGQFLVAELTEIHSYKVINGFLNLILSAGYWKGQINEIKKNDLYGFEEPNTKPTVMVEYSSPNTNKPLHLGHLRNNFLGYAVAEILKANGHRVIKTQVINDRGIHICKSMLAWKKYSPLNDKGERETPENTGLKGDKLVGKYYVAFDQYLNAEANRIIDRWNVFDFTTDSSDVMNEFMRLHEAKSGKGPKEISDIDDKIKELAKSQTSLLREAKEMLVKWEARDPEIYLLWTTMNGWVYQGFDVTYHSMGVDFDKLYYESDTFLLGKDIVMEGLKKGIFFKKSDGSVWVDLTSDGLDEKLLLRADGTSVYMTQDIGTAVDRFSDYPDLQGIIYTVGNEQDYHFKVLFLILEKMGYSWANNCFHLSYGMVDLPSGKMKSREGTVVDADDLMADVIAEATAMTKERGHLDGLSSDEKQTLFNMIGMGGLKYYLLKVDPKKRMLFDPEESIELNGNTGPFIQYAHARIQSLLAKADLEINQSVETEEFCREELDILQLLAQFPSIVKQASFEYSPAIIANYAYELVKAYNHFYQTIPILVEPDHAIKYMRLVLSEQVAKVIKSAMKLLGIKVPDRM